MSTKLYYNEGMAEAVGLAASIAGLIGLAGQVLQGGLFIQQFFEDVRGAPAEVLDLRDELEHRLTISLT
jgi:hypothetical protein